jgi:hypothetical protein
VLVVGGIKMAAESPTSGGGGGGYIILTRYSLDCTLRCDPGNRKSPAKTPPELVRN